MTDLLSLAARCEAAEGPTEALFVECFHACRGGPPEAPNLPPEDFAVWMDRWCDFIDLIRAKGWADAAMTLVPEGWEWTIESGGHVELLFDRMRGPQVEGNATTPALALCAAALRARSVQS